jgi:hypothetical protein
MVDLDRLFGAIRKELANSSQFEQSEYKPEQISYFLQVSQFLYLKSVITTLTKRKEFEYRHDTGLPAYQNIQLLDFNDMINQVNDFQLEIQSARRKIRDDLITQYEQAKENEESPPAEGEGEENKIPEEDDIEVPVNERVKAISDIIGMLSRACQYSQVS